VDQRKGKFYICGPVKKGWYISVKADPTPLNVFFKPKSMGSVENFYLYYENYSFKLDNSENFKGTVLKN
jgi:hypothetical protein